jgi:cell division protein FtsN
MEWIKNNPLVAGLIGLAIIIFIIAGFTFLSGENKREEDNLKNQGATEERNRGNEEILNKVENAARPVGDDERRRECLRNNRNPAACN